MVPPEKLIPEAPAPNENPFWTHSDTRLGFGSVTENFERRAAAARPVRVLGRETIADRAR